MTLLNPTYLWALLGLIIPIAIHLWSRKEGKTIQVGSIQLFSESDSSQSSNIKINELLLLLLRVLAIATLVIILAQPFIKGKTENTSISYFVESGLLKNEKLTHVLDTLPEGSVHVFTKDFPQYAQGENYKTSIPYYWQLAADLEDFPADSIVIFTNAYLNGIKGMRPTIASNINWITIEDDSETHELIEAKRNQSNLQLLHLTSNSNSLAFDKETIPVNENRVSISGDSLIFTQNNVEQRVRLDTLKTVDVTVFCDDELSDQMKYMAAAFNAIGNYLDRPINLDITQNLDSLNLAGAENLVWLSKNPVSGGRNRLIYKPDSLTNSLIEATLVSNEFHLTQNLNAENVIDKHLAEQLLPFLNLHPDLEKTISKLDKRVLAHGAISPVKASAKANKNTANLIDFSPWLWLLFFILLIAERILAKYRKQ